jgi:hypothetical protein
MRGGSLLKHRRTGSYMLIIDGTTETDLTLDDVENALCRRPKSCRPASPHDWLQRERDER